MKHFLYTIIVVIQLFTVSSLMAQNNDCIRSSKICFLGSPQNFPSGSSGAGTGDPGLNTGCMSEHASSWYYFTVTTGGTLTFIINPVDNSTDYDWALYKSPANDSNPATACNGSNELGAPVRCNFSATAGSTGLSTTASNPSEGAGGIPFSTSLTVVAGQVYYLLIDNFSQDGYPFSFDQGAGNTAVLDCAGVGATVNPCACATAGTNACKSLLHSTYQAASAENGTTTGNDCTIFSPVIPVDTDGDTEYEFCAERTVTAGNYGFYSVSGYELISGGTCTATMTGQNVYSTCGTPIATSGTGSNGQPYYTLAAGTYKFCRKLRLQGPDCLQYTSTCINIYTAPVPPANDLVCNAITVTCASNTAGTTINATATGEPTTSCGTTPNAPGVWYKYVAAATGAVNATTDNVATNYNTRLNVYTATGACPGALSFTCVGGDDDSGSGTTSTVTFSATSGTTYYILVNGYNGATGNFNLGITCPTAPVNDDCTGAIDITCSMAGTSSYVGNNSTATSTDPQDGTTSCAPGSFTIGTTGRGVWYKYVGNGKIVTFSTSNATTNGGTFTDTELTLYRGSDCGALTCVSSDDDSGTTPGNSSIISSFVTQVGVTYFLLLTGHSGSNGAFALDVTCVDPAYNVGGTTTSTGSTTGAAADGNALCNGNNSGSYYADNTAVSGCNVTYYGMNNSDASGTGGNGTPLMIYDASGNLNDPGGSGGNYLKKTANLVSCGGTTTSNVPANWGPMVICPNGADGGTTTLNFTTFNVATATKDNTLFGLSATDADRLIIYDGPTTNSPQLASLNGTSLPSSVTTTAGNLTGCMTVTFHENGDGTVSSGFTANWTSSGNTGTTVVPNDDCSNAQAVNFECGKFSGSTINTTASCQDPAPTQFGDETGYLDDLYNTSWYKFTVPAGAGGSTTVRLTNISCPATYNSGLNPLYRGLKGGIFDGGTAGICPSLSTVNTVRYNPVDPGIDAVSWNFPAFTATAGNTYYIGIAGYLGSQCDFDIEVDRYTDFNAVVNTASLTVPAAGCNGTGVASTGYYRCSAAGTPRKATIVIDLSGGDATYLAPVMTVNGTTLAACSSTATRFMYELSDGDVWSFSATDGLCTKLLSGQYIANDNCNVCGTYTKNNLNINGSAAYTTATCGTTVNLTTTIDAAKATPVVITSNAVPPRKYGTGVGGIAPENYVADYKKYVHPITTGAINAALIGTGSADAKVSSLNFTITAKWADMKVMLKNSSCAASATLWNGTAQGGGDATNGTGQVQLSYSSSTGIFSLVTDVASYTTPSVTTANINTIFAGCDPEKFYLEINDNSSSVLQYSINSFDIAIIDKPASVAVTTSDGTPYVWYGSGSTSGGASGNNTNVAELTTFSTPFTSATFTPPFCAGPAACVYSYNVTGKSVDGCTISGIATITVNPLPTITLSSTSTTACAGATSATLAYTATTNSPDQYSIDFNAAANTAGFVDVTNSALPASPITITVPAGAAAGSYTATLSVRNSTTGCVSSTTTITVVVTPLPTITLSSTTANACVGSTSATLAYTASTGTPDQYSLDFNATAEGQGFVDVTNGALPASPITITVPAGAAAGSYTATLSVRNSTTGCVSSTTTVTVVVNTLPTITLSSTTTATCSGNTSATLAYTATTGSPNQYSVDYDATAEGQGFVDVTNSALPATPITLTVPAGAAPGTYNAAITVRNSTTTCSSTTYNVTVTVNARPVITAGLTETVCSGVATNRTITLSTDLPGTETYAWNTPVVTGSMTGGAAGTGSTIINTLTNTTATAQTATYVVTVTAAAADGGCTSTANVVITVNPRPVITAGLTQAICSGTAASRTITLSTDLAGTETFAWGIPTMTAGVTGGVAGSGSSITDVLSNSGTTAGTATYVVTVTADAADGGCTNTANVVITVNPVPVITSGLTAEACSGVAVSRSITLSTDPSGAETYSWAAPVNTGGMTGGTSGTVPPITGTFTNNTASAQTATYTVVVTGASAVGSCTSSRDVVITVNPLPTVNAGSDVAICNGGSAALSAAGSGGTGALSYSWTPAGTLTGASTATPTATPTSTTTYIVTVSDTKLCSATDNVQVTVNAAPTATAAATNVTCAGSVANADGKITISGFTLGTDKYDYTTGATYSGSATYTTATLIPAGGIIVSNLTNPAVSQQYTVRIFSSSDSGCYIDRTVTLTNVNCTCPTITLAPTTAAACAGSANISFTQTGGAASGTWTIDSPMSGGGSIVAATGVYSPPATVASPTTVVIKYSEPSPSNCFGTHTITINPVPAAPTATVTAQPTCATATGTITVTAPAAGAGITYTVTGTSPVVAAVSNATGIFAGLTTGTYNVTTSANGCTSSPISLTVNAQPTPPAAATASTTIQPTCAVATGTIVVTAPLGATLEYNIDGGAYQSSTTFAGVAAGSHTILVRSTTDNTCVSSSTSVTVDPQPATPSISSTPTTCTGSTYSITVNATVSSGTLEYSLDGGAYQTSNTFTALANGSTHSVTVRTVGTTCTATTSGITATCACAAPPAVAITQTTLSTCGTNLVTLNYIVTNGPATMTSSGTGTFSSTTLSDGTGSITYTPSAGDAGTTVTLTATIADPDGAGICAASSDFVTLTVNARPATVAGASSSVNCGGTINLTSTPTGAVSYSWVGPNGYTANVQNPVRTTATASMTGTYTVTVTGTNGCTASATTSVTVGGCTFVFRISDPCSCRNNATTLTNGQFNEVVTVYGPAGFVVRAETITGLYQTSSTALVTVPFSTPVPMTHNGLSGAQSGYILQGVHVDDIGYTVTVGIYESDGVTPVDLDPATAGVQNNMTVANKCAYPNPDFALASSTVCNHPANTITLTATNSYGPNGTGVFSGIGVSGTTFNPTVAGTGGPYAILLTYTGGITVATTDLDGDGDIDASDNGVSIDNGITPAFPGCIQPLTKSITVIDCCNSDSGTW